MSTLVVIDTNILVSALLAPQGNEALMVRSIPNGDFIPCITNGVMDEYVEVLTRPKFKARSDKVSELLAVLRANAKFFSSRGGPYESPDPTDTKFLQCAFAASADFLVTGNKRHFPSSPYGSTRVVSTRELFERLDLHFP